MIICCGNFISSLSSSGPIFILDQPIRWYGTIIVLFSRKKKKKPTPTWALLWFEIEFVTPNNLSSKKQINKYIKHRIKRFKIYCDTILFKRIIEFTIELKNWDIWYLNKFVLFEVQMVISNCAKSVLFLFFLCFFSFLFFIRTIAQIDWDIPNLNMF